MSRGKSKKPLPLFNPRYPVVLPCEVWLAIRDGARRYISRTRKPPSKFRVLPKAVEVIEQHTANANKGDDVVIDGFSTTFGALANLCMEMGLWDAGRQLVTQTSNAEFRTK